MTEHRTGTREQWQAAYEELLKVENEHAERSEELAKQRRELPWVPVDKEYSFETDAGKKTLAELFVTLLCFSRAPLSELQAYKERMEFPYVSTYGSDFVFDFTLALTEEQMQGHPEVRQMIDDPPDWLKEWSEKVGAPLELGLAESPTWIAFALEDGVVYHTYSRAAPDRDFVVPYYHPLLDRTPKGRSDEFRAWRHDEYEETVR